MKLVTNFFLILTVSSLLFYGGILLLSVKAADYIDNTLETEYIERVGTKLVIDNDTLTITDYSVLNTNFTLSNGAKISKNYFKNK